MFHFYVGYFVIVLIILIGLHILFIFCDIDLCDLVQIIFIIIKITQNDLLKLIIFIPSTCTFAVDTVVQFFNF